MKEIIGKMDFIKIQIFYSVKGNVPEMRREATDWEKIFAKDTSNKGALPNIYKEHLNLKIKKAKPHDFKIIQRL